MIDNHNKLKSYKKKKKKKKNKVFTVIKKIEKKKEKKVNPQKDYLNSDRPPSIFFGPYFLELPSPGSINPKKKSTHTQDRYR